MGPSRSTPVFDPGPTPQARVSFRRSSGESIHSGAVSIQDTHSRILHGPFPRAFNRVYVFQHPYFLLVLRSSGFDQSRNVTGLLRFRHSPRRLLKRTLQRPPRRTTTTPGFYYGGRVPTIKDERQCSFLVGRCLEYREDGNGGASTDQARARLYQ